MLLFALLLPPLAQGLANLAETVLLTDYVESFGARCLDGTPQRIWIQRSSTGSRSWALHFMGGGWCPSIESCAARAYGYACYLGSSDPRCFDRQSGDMPPWENFTSVMDFSDIPSCLGARWCGGLMINDAERNPLTSDWNRVLMSYCSGDGWVGNNNSVTLVSFNGTDNLPLYFRGGRNAAAVFDYLNTQEGLGMAEEVILSGDSAGGLACYSHADALAAYLGPTTRLLVAPDSGFFFSYDLFPSWKRALTWVSTNGNATAYLNQACVAAKEASAQDPFTCIFPEEAAAHITTPLFCANSKYDPALTEISGGESGKNVSNTNRIGAALLDLVNKTVLSTGRQTNGAFLPSCQEHCGQWGTNQSGIYPDFRPLIDGTSQLDALAQWRADLVAGRPGRRLWVQQASFPCNTCCQGGQE